ncbi:Acyl-lipid (9-3)-desaturase [Seminavis robusta]|uniref:Acyl-lipid (9-3)-desaturase n=1 Tax=Seminavis robusta TaxID=568900 RepID=A0A9N8E3A2_9STRA|nr:Acyl-lipid (9-3)-desaturase [Seminavis robusta]|eukprot:Sro500_g155350.1 Acyl-lipid (9-3)-desaturase (942) ;mRNA; f:54552-58055
MMMKRTLASWLIFVIPAFKQATAVTLEEVALHATNNDCWSAIYDKVYNLTAYAPNHPGNGGSADTVYLLCGIEGTSMYNSFHVNNPQYLDTLAGIEFKGPLTTKAPTMTPSVSPTEGPTESPSASPSSHPSVVPTVDPSDVPTSGPSASPSVGPSTSPSASPSASPSSQPSVVPTVDPSDVPTSGPSASPSVGPSSTPSGTPSPTSSSSPTASPTIMTYYTMADVRQHSTESSCWSSIYGKVYDLSLYAPTHPGNGGGRETVYLLCGIEGTSMYESFHRTHPEWLDELPGIEFKGLSVDRRPTDPPTPSPTNTPSISPSDMPSLTPSVTPSKVPSVSPTESSDSPTTVPSSSPSSTPSGSPSSGPTASPTTLQPTISASPTSSPTEVTYVTLDDVKLHADPSDCWSAIYEKVYDLTGYAPLHPANGGGQDSVFLLCGINGTATYISFHGSNPEYLDIFPGIEFKGLLGVLVPTGTVAASGVVPTDTSFMQTQAATATETQVSKGTTLAVSRTELAKHNTPDDCWVIYHSEVFDVTTYAPTHPSGASVVTADCGGDGTTSFSVFHEIGYLEMIRTHFLGSISDGASSSAGPGLTNRPTQPPVVSTVMYDSGGHSDSDEGYMQQQPQTAPPNTNGALVSVQEMRSHNSVDDCWVAYFGEVFDVTEYAPQHPAGASLVTSNCGHDDTESYSLFHDYSELESIRQYFKGMLTDEPQPEATVEQSGEETGSTASESNPSVPESPGAADIPILENGKVHFMALQQHSTPDDCWVSYFDEVYDMTRYAPLHPPGSETVTNNCGEDGTKDYEIFHERSLLVLVKVDYIGDLDTSTIVLTPDTEPPNREPQALTMDEVAAHNNPGSCYVRYYDDVYDLTYYSHPSPPGQSVIYLGCGVDSTKDFASAHPRTLLEQVEEFRVGWIESSSPRLRAGVTTVVGLVASLWILLA